MTGVPAAFVPKAVHEAPCKCCGAATVGFGAVDFSKSCEDTRRPPLPPTGIAIEYRRCPACGFVFTVAFDDFTPDDFRAHVYNDGYADVDPDFALDRPRNNAQWLADTIFPSQKSLRMLDYGGGDGTLAGHLRAAGFTNVETYDPFYGGGRPGGRYEVITCFEVFEHTPTPFETAREIRSLLADPGLLIFSTLMQPSDLAETGLSWWYAAPRNGHVSLHSRESITALFRRLGLKWGSFNDVVHVAYRGRMPAFARHLTGG